MNNEQAAHTQAMARKINDHIAGMRASMDALLKSDLSRISVVRAHEQFATLTLRFSKIEQILDEMEDELDEL